MWLTLLIIALSLALYFKLVQNKGKNEYWKNLGIPFIDTSKIASTLELTFGLKTFIDVDKIVYDKMGSNKFCGIMDSGSPCLIVKDLDLAKDIFIKDFEHFVDRPLLFSNSGATILQKMLCVLAGSEWRGTRIAISPTFTTGKIRKLMESFNGCGVEWVKTLKENPSRLLCCDIKEAAGQYATDVIAAAVFGLNVGCIRDTNSLFYKQTHRLLGDTSWSIILRQSLALRFPGIFKLLGVEALDKSSLQFFDEILETTLKAREAGEVSERNDFIQFLVQARKGLLKEEAHEDMSKFEREGMLSGKQSEAKHYLLDDDVVKGQGFIFFLAGFQGVNFSICYTIHALAHFPDIQERVRAELEGKFDSNGKIEYDVLNKLEYLEMVTDEIQRFYPITPRLSRIVTKPYNRPDLGLNLPKNSVVHIPLLRIHRDPKYFPNPDQFNPENFTAENKAKRHSYAYMPFGHGPRNCIGMRLGLVEVKTVVAIIVHNFIIEKVPGSTFPLKTVLIGQGTHLPDGVDVKLTPRF